MLRVLVSYGIGEGVDNQDLCGNQPVCRVHPIILH
jgi:hypothetical protein